MRQQQGLDEAQTIRTGRQAEQGAVGVQAIPASLRSSGIGLTESKLSADSRAVRGSTTGSIAGDLFFETDTTWLYRWTGTAWAWMEGVYIAADATRTALTISSVDNGAIFFATDTLSLWQVSGGAWTKRLEIKGTANQISATIASGVLTLALVASPDVTTSYKVNGIKVVGTQGLAIADVAAADASDLASAITLVNELKSKFNTSLARNRAHGLIAT